MMRILACAALFLSGATYAGHMEGNSTQGPNMVGDPLGLPRAYRPSHRLGGVPGAREILERIGAQIPGFAQDLEAQYEKNFDQGYNPTPIVENGQVVLSAEWAAFREALIQLLPGSREMAPNLNGVGYVFTYIRERVSKGEPMPELVFILGGLGLSYGSVSQ